MAIFRGVGGSGDSSDNSFLDAVTAQANSASASATFAANSLAAIQQTEVTSASFDTGNGVLTLTKTGGATVTADLDGRFLTSYTETNDLSTAVTWANVPDANITQSSVTQYLTAANVTSPLTGGTGISIASNGTITNDSPDQTVALTGTGATTITGTYPNFTINSVNTTYTVGDGGLTTNDFTDADHTKLDGIEASADVTDATNVTSAGAAMLDSSPTFTGTITAPNLDISTTGSVTTNIATGGAGSSVATKTLNLGTGYSGFFAGLTTVNVGTQDTGSQNVFNIGSGVSTAGKEDTINLKGNVTVDGTVDGRDVATDGAKLDTIPYHRVRYEKLRYNNASVTLTTSYQNIGQAPEIYSPTTSVKCSRYIDFQTEIEWRYISSTNNDLKFKLEVTVPTSNATVTTLGTVTAGTFSGYTVSGFEGWFYVSGDFTHHLTAFGRMNKTGLNNATEVPARAWHYDPLSNRTYILTDSNPGYSVNTGDTMYWHPYAWESAGTTLFVEDTLSERYVGTGSRQNITLRFKTAYDSNQLKYKAYLKELLSTDSAIVRGGEATLTEVGEV
jgi:hypothetical protein